MSVSSASTEAGCESGAAITGAGGGTCCAGAGERKNTINLSIGTAHHLEGMNMYISVNLVVEQQDFDQKAVISVVYEACEFLLQSQ